MSDNYGQAPSGGQPPQPPSSPWASVSAAPPVHEHRRNGGITAGVVLIAIGAIFLAGQFVPGVAWWSLWPLLVVLGGVIQMFTPGHHGTWTVLRMLDGLGTVLVGGVLLANTLGLVSWQVWWTFVTLWPVLVIALGISILGRGLNQTWIRGAAMVLVWGALAYAVAVSAAGIPGFRPITPFVSVNSGQPYSYSEPVGTTTSASLAFNGGAGDITVHSGSDLINATGTTPFGAPEFSVVRSGATAAVKIALGTSDKGVVAPNFSGGEADIALAGPVVWDATIETGASTLDADLSDVQVKSLVLKTGVSDSTVKLGEVPVSVGATNVEVKSGVSDVKILVPADAAVRVNTHNGLESTTIAKSLKATSPGVWETPDFASAARIIDISIDSGISSVSVETY